MGRKMRRETVVVLLVVVALAGCGEIVPGVGERDPSSTPTLTPVPVPVETDSAGGRVLAPGLSTNGVFDDDALVSANRAELTDRGFVMVRNWSVFRPNATSSGDGPRTLVAVGIAAVVEPGADTYRFTRVERSDRRWPIVSAYTLFAVWYSDPMVRYRFVDDRRGERLWGQERAASGGPMLDTTESEDVRTDLSAVDLRVVGNATEDGTRVYRLRGTGIVESAELDVPPLLSAPHNATMVASIDERGVVRSYTLTFDATFDGGPVRVRQTHRVTEIGTTTVEAPAWFPEANRSVRNRAG